jgi:preprotein translocase subunit SecY
MVLSDLQGTGILLAVTTIYQYVEVLEKEGSEGNNFVFFNSQF